MTSNVTISRDRVAVGGTIDPGQRMYAVCDPPVPLQTLRGDAGAHPPAVFDPFCQPGIIAVEQHRGVAVQAVDLDEAGSGHWLVSPVCVSFALEAIR